MNLILLYVWKVMSKLPFLIFNAIVVGNSYELDPFKFNFDHNDNLSELNICRVGRYVLNFRLHLNLTADLNSPLRAKFINFIAYNNVSKEVIVNL